jgi:hypothetical protein
MRPRPTRQTSFRNEGPPPCLTTERGTGPRHVGPFHKRSKAKQGGGGGRGPPITWRSEAWWTRSQRIRTEGEIPFELALLETSPPPLYQQIARRAAALKSLGVRTSRIAAELSVDETTVRRALAWARRVPG